MFRIITIPFDSDKGIFLEDDLNKFCMNKKVKSYKTEFFVKDSIPYWSVFTEYNLFHEKAIRMNKAETLSQPIANTGDEGGHRRSQQYWLFDYLKDTRIV